MAITIRLAIIQLSIALIPVAPDVGEPRQTMLARFGMGNCVMGFGSPYFPKGIAMSETMHDALMVQTERARKLQTEKDQLLLNLAILQNNFEELLGAYRDEFFIAPTRIFIAPTRKETRFTMMMREALDKSRAAFPENAMDWPIPCDLTVGHGTITKGCKFSVVQTRMKALFDLAHGDRVTMEAPALRPDPRY